MKNSQGRKRGKKYILLAIILGIVCISGVELIACRIFAPELFVKVTGPVVRAAQLIGGLASDIGDAAAGLWDELKPEPTPEAAAIAEPAEAPAMDSQLASQPRLFSDPPIADPLVTELRTENGRQVLTGGVYRTVYFNQGDEQWASKPFGGDDIGGYGCGPVALAMVVASMTEHETDPETMSRWAYENGYWCSGSGSYHTIVKGTAESFGLEAEAIGEYTPDAITEALLGGKLLVALMGPGHFTSGGHFIVLRGITLSGKILVADPNSTERSLATWDAQLLLDELNQNGDAEAGAPLWVISRP